MRVKKKNWFQINSKRLTAMILFYFFITTLFTFPQI